MFSKALFKQSCKANGTMWGIVTAAVCFMLACVMLISGNGNIGEVKNSIQDTIITKEIDAQLEKRALAYYENAKDGLSVFDAAFVENAQDTLGLLLWYSSMPKEEDFSDPTLYAAYRAAWEQARPTLESACGRQYAERIAAWQTEMPARESFSSEEVYLAALTAYAEASPLSETYAVTLAYGGAVESLQTCLRTKAESAGYADGSAESDELLGSVLYVLNPNGMFDNFYGQNMEEIPEEYDISSLLFHLSAKDVTEYLSSTEREEYRGERSAALAPVFLAGNAASEESVTAMIEALSAYGVTKEKYDTFGYTYDAVKAMATTATVTYRARAAYELSLVDSRYADGEFSDRESYLEACAEVKERLRAEIAADFLSTLPTEVSDALEEIGRADLYTLIVGSIFYKLAGLLLPIIYMIMASNNLIAGQVDSGSMAYVLSTSTRRETVVFTQAVYLVGSLFAMLSLMSLTGCVCLALVSEEVGLTYGKLLLLNVGAFLVLFALSGLCFFTSCVFDRSKRSMAIGGGLSVFALVAAMLGLFGSPAIPSVVRLSALNYFNYTTVISLFDVISIVDGTLIFLPKLAILAALGICGYIAGSLRFVKKDLPL